MLLKFLFSNPFHDHLQRKSDVLRFDLKIIRLCCTVGLLPKTAIYWKRESNAAVLFNNCKPFVLYRWQANMDIQCVTFASGAAK